MTNTSLTFNFHAFVGRKKELDRVRDIVKELKKGSTSQPKSIVFQGEMGMGKTWLLQHLHKEFENDEGIKVLYCDLKNYSGQDIAQSVIQIMKSFVGGDGMEITAMSPAQASVDVIKKIQDLIKEKPLVILADHVYESDWKLLSELENHLFGPLAIEPQTFFVLAGRGREYPWKTPELRLRAEFIDLRPFSKDETKEQMKNISSAAERNTENTYAVSKGVPLLNFLLTDVSREKLDDAINYTLQTVPQNERKEIRTYLEALSVLRYFDEERIPDMLEAYDPRNKKIGTQYAEASRIRDELVRSSFAHWDDEIGGFVMDPSLQGVLKRYLQQYDSKRWTNLHIKAANLYKRWKTQYPAASRFWEKEIKYHSEALGESQKKKK